MEKLNDSRFSLEHLSEEELEVHRARLSELAADLPGTLARLSEDAQADYRDAEQSVIDARLDIPRDHS